MLGEFVSSSDGPGEEDPLIKCGRLTQEDWCVMEWSDKHEAYYLTAGSTVFCWMYILRRGIQNNV